GRSQFMREIGSNYAKIEASGYMLPVTEIGLRYLGSLRYGERVRVSTWIEENRSRRLSFAYEVQDISSGNILVTGFTRHVWTDASGNVTRMPEQLRRLFDSKMISPDISPVACGFTPRFRVLGVLVSVNVALATSERACASKTRKIK
ncbi:MAG: thioesterase family protein, partial [Proteobacteria bacterium]|nr:thioesterase family protein [Pseudomonadota bacterium]